MSRKIDTYIIILLPVFIITGGLLLSGCAAELSSESPSAGLVRQGEKLIDDNEYKEAVSILRRAVGIDPQYAPAYRGLGIAYYGAGDLYRAEIFMRKALQMNEKFSELWGYLGDIYIQKGDEKKAMSFFERCPPDDPHYAELHFRLGKMRLKSSDIEDADVEFTKALTHDDFWGGYWGKGYLAQLRGDWDEALNWYRQANNRAKKPEIILGLAKSYDMLKHYEPAFFYYTIYLGNEITSEERANVEKRIAQLEKMINLMPDSTEHTLNFSLNKNCNVSAGVYERSGKMVKMLFSGILSRGKYNLTWDGSNQDGKPVSSGEYIGFVLIEDECMLHKFLIR